MADHCLTSVPEKTEAPAEPVSRKEWRTPTITEFAVDETETDFTGGTDVGFFGS